jgi:hypothetical protein
MIATKTSAERGIRLVLPHGFQPMLGCEMHLVVERLLVILALVNAAGQLRWHSGVASNLMYGERLRGRVCATRHSASLSAAFAILRGVRYGPTTRECRRT